MEVEDFFTETMAGVGGSGGRGGGKEGGEWHSGFGMLFWVRGVGGVWRGDEVTIPTWTKNEQVIS